jgi:hypothetical protein
LTRTSRAAAVQPLARLALTAATAVALVASTAVAPASAAGGDATVLTVGVSRLLTLPEGDGVNDTTEVTITADAEITAQPQILDASAGKVGPALAPVPLTDPDADGTFTGTVTLSGLGLPAGAYSVTATEVLTQTLTASAPLKVGSGSAVDVAVTSANTSYPHKDGYLDALKATVTVRDETGTPVPYAGSVIFTAGTLTRTATIASTTGAAASASVSVTGLAPGKGSLTAKVHGPAGPDKVSAAKVITLASTQVKSVSVARSVGTIYPALDGYRDAGVFTFASTFAGPPTMPVTGAITISLNGKTVKSWKLTTTATRSFTWNGLNGGTIVPGTYTVKVSAKGPQGSTKSASISVNVSKKKLVSRTATKTVNAKRLFTEYIALDEQQQGECWYTVDEVIGCDGFEADDSGLSLYSAGSFAVPLEIRNAFSPSVRVTANVDFLKGEAGWAYYYGDDPGQSGDLAVGNTTLGWLKVLKSPSRVSLDFGLAEFSSVDIDYYKIEYRYKVLV